MNYDQEIELRSHPENVEGICDTCEETYYYTQLESGVCSKCIKELRDCDEDPKDEFNRIKE